MATNRALRKAVLAKLGLTQQALSRRVQLKKDRSPMSTEDATYLVAHEAGIRIDKYLDVAQVDRVRSLHAQLGVVIPAATAQRKVQKAKPPVARQLRFANNFRVKSSVLPAAKLDEAKEMAQLYPILYVLENSMREVVQRVMKRDFGSDWWDTQLTAGKLRSVHQTASSRLASEQTRQKWHQRRGAHPIDYIGLDELGDIILGKQAIFFQGVLGSDVDWFKHFMKELEPSRNVLCHMNPLSDTNARDLMTKLERWESLISGAGTAIPAS
jgi:hypothetical protein